MSQKQMPKKKKTINTNGIICLRQKSNYRFNQFTFNMVNNTTTKWQNSKLVFHLPVSHTTIHVDKLIPCLSSKKQTMMNKRKMATLMPFDDRQFKLGETSATKFRIWRDLRHIICPHKTNPKVSTWHSRNFSFNRTFIQSICTEQLFENSSHRASLLLICIPLSIHAIGRRNQDSP